MKEITDFNETEIEQFVELLSVAKTNRGIIIKKDKSENPLKVQLTSWMYKNGYLNTPKNVTSDSERYALNANGFVLNIQEEYIREKNKNSKSTSSESSLNESTQFHLKVFISYSSADERIVKEFIDKILVLAYGLKKENIDCLAIQDRKPQTGVDFRDWIKMKIKQSNLAFLMISETYRKSEICMNEVGALWMLDIKKIPVLIPPIDYNNVGVINDKKHCIKINQKEDLLKLGNDLELKVNTASEIYDQVSRFVDFVSHEEQSNKNVHSTHIDPSFFELFKTQDPQSIILSAQPTLYDCYQIFQKRVFEDAYEIYSSIYRDGIVNPDLKTESSRIHSIELSSWRFNKDEDLKTIYNDMIYAQSIFVLRPKRDFYHIKLLDQDGHQIGTMKEWTFANNRWIYLPKLKMQLYTINQISSIEIDKKLPSKLFNQLLELSPKMQ